MINNAVCVVNVMIAFEMYCYIYLQAETRSHLVMSLFSSPAPHLMPIFGLLPKPSPCHSHSLMSLTLCHPPPLPHPLMLYAHQEILLEFHSLTSLLFSLYFFKHVTHFFQAPFYAQPS